MVDLARTSTSVASAFRGQPLIVWLLTVVLMTSCTQLETKTTTPTPTKIQPPQTVDDRPFESDTLYSLLVAEMAGDRHRFDIMLSNYVQQAEATLDPGVTARATRLARYLSAHNTTLEMALRWLELQPESAEAHYIAAAELVHSNLLLDAVPHAKFLLQHGEASGFDAIGGRAQQGGDIETTKELITQFDALLIDYPSHMPLHLGLSLLHQHAGHLDKALEHSQTAIRLDPEDFQSAAQETRILQQMGRTEQALSKLGGLVDRNPDNMRLRMQYAKALLKTDLADAQKQFETLLSQSPNDADILLTLALIQYERGLLSEAKQHFLAVLNSKSHQSSAHYYLGRIALIHKDDADAMDHFAKVRSGRDYLPAMAQLTELMSAKGQATQALQLIQEQRANTPSQLSEQIEGLYLLESHLFSTQGQHIKALASLEPGLEEFPDSVSLLYTRATLLTQLGKLAEAERAFKHLLKVNPDHAGALNAWGYTLADRAERLDEAYQYISRAYQLSPNDPAVIDSMGWVEYRRGNIETALTILRKAMTAMPDHEIAAHLGEVLWVSGKRDEARKVWQQGLQLKVESEVIKQTMIRLNAVQP